MGITFFQFSPFELKEAQIKKIGMIDGFISKQVSLPKITLLLQKLKSAQKAIYALFEQKPSILNLLLMHLSFNRERKKLAIQC